ncbi:MAG: hypothetical protein H6684_04245 [Deltaproteobacteria bacterium]|nr:hypothetical protein [Deltaproteobacteria bacterium]
MTKKTTKRQAQKRQQKAMKKRSKTLERHRKRGSSVASENAIQHQMIGEFGSIDNFVRNMQKLAEMFNTEEALKELRFDPRDIYDKLDATRRTVHDALEDLYSNTDITYYDEKFEGFWGDRRSEILPDLISDELVSHIDKTFKALQLKKRGLKKEYRAVMAGALLIQSHKVALTEAPVHENGLWEIMFNATLKENPIELPEVTTEDELEPPKSEDDEAATDDAAEAAGENESEDEVDPSQISLDDLPADSDADSDAEGADEEDEDEEKDA